MLDYFHRSHLPRVDVTIEPEDTNCPCCSAPMHLIMFNGKDNGSIAYYNWFAYEFWRFVFVQQVVGKAAQTLIDFPPMQGGASFNMSAVKSEIDKAIAARAVSK
jgi:hypothetical protein